MMSLPPGRRTRCASFSALPRLQIFRPKDIEYASTLLSATAGILSASSCLNCAWLPSGASLRSAIASIFLLTSDATTVLPRTALCANSRVMMSPVPVAPSRSVAQCSLAISCATRRFHNRWMPRLKTSHKRSYRVARCDQIRHRAATRSRRHCPMLFGLAAALRYLTFV
jgi:hypothetical protein